jgi:hypothetical protein
VAALYLADTSAWNRFGQSAPIWKERLASRLIATCEPVLLELLYSAKGRSDYRSLRSDLSLLPQLELNGHAARLALRTQSELAERSQHRGPAPVDLLVAAIAEVHGATVVHYDRHFDAIARVSRQPVEWLARRGTLQ